MFSRKVTEIIVRSPLLAQPQAQAIASASDKNLGSLRRCIKPQAILDVVHRRGRSWGLLAQYEESRLKSVL